MQKKIDCFVAKLIRQQVYKDEEDVFLSLILMAASAFEVLIHGFLLVFFTMVQYPSLLLVNAGSIAVGVVGFFLAKKRKHTAAGLLIAIEVAIYGLVSSLLIGTQTFSFLYFFLVIIVQVVIPYTRPYIRVLVLVAHALLIIITFVIGYFYPPINPLEKGVFVLSFVNLTVTIVGAVVELMVGNKIKSIIAQFNLQRMNLLQEKAYRDELTGLYNRRYASDFFDKLPAVEVSRGWCVAMLDIDDFKNVNDNFGHDAGDDVLCDIANTIQESLRKTDLVFRWGGEEFLIVLADVNLRTAYQVMEKMRAEMQKKEIYYTDKCLKITITAGVSVLDFADIDGSIKRCDKKLYRGKQQGKNQIVI